MAESCPSTVSQRWSPRNLSGLSNQTFNDFMLMHSTDMSPGRQASLLPSNNNPA